MKKTLRRILSLTLAFILICTLTTTAFAVATSETELMIYPYDDKLLTHKILGYSNQVHAVISIEYTNGDPIPAGYSFYHDGYIDYQYCPENQLRPDRYIANRKTSSGTAIGSSKIISTNQLSSGYMMIDASMWFKTEFDTTHASINHKYPDTIYVCIY